MKKIILLLIFSFPPIQAQKVQITEIQSRVFLDQKEWFEFQVEDGFDLTKVKNWFVGNKPLENALQSFDNGFFVVEPSPISLPDGGGSIEIFDENQTPLTKALYPATKSGKRKDYAWAEILNWEETHKKFVPLLLRDQEVLHFQDSKGYSNAALPTLPQDFEILISEFSPDHEDRDFIELQVTTSVHEKINLKYLALKHNGTLLWYFEKDFWVRPGDFLTFYLGTLDHGIIQNHNPYTFHTNKKSGLSAGSGSVEILLWHDTSLEILEDFACWKNKTLSKTEQKRVDKNQASWKGECLEIEALIPNQSMARSPGEIDSDSLNDFFPHFNGSPGQKNIPQNQAPIPKINIQGSGQIQGLVPFSVNLDGQDSTDPNGDFDIQHYRWFLNNTLVSEKPNPSTLKITTPGKHIITLQIEDFSGEESTITQEFLVQTPGGATLSYSKSIDFKKDLHKKIEGFRNTKKLTSKALETDFFAEVLDNEAFLKTITSSPHLPTSKAFSSWPKKDPSWPRKIQLPLEIRQKVAKNIGFILVWREVMWKAPESEVFFDEEVDQNWSHFALRALEF